MNRDHGRTLPENEISAEDPDDRATGKSRRFNWAENFLFLVGFSYTFCCVENPDDIDPWWTICGTFAELDAAGVYHFSNASTNADPAHAAPEYVQNGLFWLLTNGRDRIMNPRFGSRCLLVKEEPAVRMPHCTEVGSTVSGRIVPFRSRRRYALADAVRTSDFDGAKAALERGEDVRIPSDVSGLTAAFMAAHRGDAGILSLLLDHGLDIDAPVDGICVRATEQDTFLVDGVVTESDGYLGGKERALLHIAAANGHLRVIEMLVQRGANIERTFRGPLGEWGESTPLLTAAKYDQGAAVELLLRCGADVHFMRRIDGCTSLHMAASKGNRRIIKALLGAGANVCNEDIGGYNAAHLAVTSGRGVETVELLLDAGDANIHHVRPFDGHTLLLDAASGGQTATVLMLLQRGASVNQTCNGGESALFMASIYKGSVDVVKVLLDHGANINLCDVNGCTPLSFAVMRGEREVVKELLERNADVNFANRFGKTPLELASSVQFSLNPNIDLGIFHALLERGANIDLLRDPFSLGFERFPDGVEDCVRHCLEFIAEVRFQAAEEPSFAHKLIRDVVELGCFPAPLAQWVPILYPTARAELKAWSSHALGAERMCFAGFFDETADAETSRQSEVEGPVAEELASMSVYPLAATRRLLREMEFFFAHGKIASSNTLSTAPSSDSDTAQTPVPTESWQDKMKRWKAV
jgi:ankyrin repeat protein